MKNIYVLPTDKESKLFRDDTGVLLYSINIDQEQNHFKAQHIYITSDEDINENDYIITKDERLVQVSYLLSKDLEYASKVILTTDQNFDNGSIQVIGDEFIRWYVNNPGNNKVETHKFGFNDLEE